ncbi:MAG TPA: VanZ family protein [Euryarchaeota archaeon]|nr:VanZ family protein [Euryarchaeota archaeon]
MKKKALVLSYGSHFIVLFAIIVLLTFARSDFDFIITGIVSAAYTAFVTAYFAFLYLLLRTREKGQDLIVKKEERKSIGSAAKHWLLVLFYVALIFYLSSISDLPIVSKISEFDPRKYSLHLLEYMGLAFFIYPAFRSTGFGRWKSALMTILLSASIAYGDETFQISIPGRRFNIVDFYADTVGAALGTLLSMIRRLLKKSFLFRRQR